MRDDVTVVVGVDKRTIQQLLISYRTWQKHRPEMWRMPWLVFYDWSQPNGLHGDDVRHVIRHQLGLRNAHILRWPNPLNSDYPLYANQREKMLSGFVWVPPRHIETRWFVKIDTDVIALRPMPMHDWLKAEWLAAYNKEGDHYCWIGSPWGYTKPAHQPYDFDNWADTVSGLKDFPRLNIPWDSHCKRCPHPRMCSWLFFCNTDWSRMALQYVKQSCGYGRIPVPSQDGYHFLVAERRGDKYLRYKMKKLGWTNISNIAKLRIKAAEAMH